MSRKSHKIQRIRAAIALAATLVASLVLLVPSASAGRPPSADFVRAAASPSVFPNGGVNRRVTAAADQAAAATGSPGAERFDARDAFGVAILLASLGLGTGTMLWNYAREKSVGWVSTGGGGRWS